MKNMEKEKDSWKEKVPRGGTGNVWDEYLVIFVRLIVSLARSVLDWTGTQ